MQSPQNLTDHCSNWIHAPDRTSPCQFACQSFPAQSRRQFQVIVETPATRAHLAAEAVQQDVQTARRRGFLKRVVEVVPRTPGERRFKPGEVLNMVERSSARGRNVLPAQIGPGAEF